MNLYRLCRPWSLEVHPFPDQYAFFYHLRLRQQKPVPQYQLVPLRVLQLDRFHSFALLFYLVLHFLDQNHRAKPLFDRLTHLVLVVHWLVLQELLVHLTYLFYLQQVFQNEFSDQLRYCQNPRKLSLFV